MSRVIIHTNMRLPNQVESAGWLKEGFDSKGIEALVTGDRYAAADVHVIQGPWYAYKDWIGKPNVLFLNRCFYGDARFDLSLGWLNPDGSRDFCNKGMTEGKGKLPELKPRKQYRGTCIVFGDFGRDMSDECRIARDKHPRCYFRPHPASDKHQSPFLEFKGGVLETLLDFADVAIGHSSTVLVACELAGLHVTSTDPFHVVHHDGDREQWLRDLSWAQWNHEELKRGDFVEHLL